jgi:hypothetical protein
MCSSNLAILNNIRQEKEMVIFRTGHLNCCRSMMFWVLATIYNSNKACLVESIVPDPELAG